MAGEWYHILYNNVYGIKSCSLRLTNTYGLLTTHKTFTARIYRMVFIRQIVERKEIQIFGDGSQLRDFNYVDDVCDAMLQVALSKNSCEIFIILIGVKR